MNRIAGGEGVTMGGWIETPGGIGQYYDFNGISGMVTVLMDYDVLVEYPGDKCFPVQGGTNEKS